MPLSGKLPAGSTYTGPYPRSKDSIWYILRTVLLFCWTIIGLYATDAIWNVYFTENTAPKPISTFNGLLSALVIPAFIRNPNAPLGVSLLFAIPFVCILFGCLWATRDWRREQKTKQEQDIHKGIDNVLQAFSPDKQFVKPEEPPFDTENPFQPDEFIGRSEELEWLLKRLRAGKKNRVTALWGREGIGKTVLVVEALRRLHAEKRFKDGMAVIPCQGINNVEEILRRIIIRFDPHSRPPESNEPHELKKNIYRLFYGKNALVVLDEVERTLAIKEVLEYLFTAKDITILLTARHMLEASHKLEPLSAKESLDLFAQSFEEAVNNPDHAGHSKAMSIVKKLGYNPYAIKTVGSYAHSCGRDLGALEQELNVNEMLLQVIDIADNYKAVRLAFETSTKEHDALPPGSRKLFFALTAFTDTEFSRDAVVALARALNVERSVDLLVQRGLVDAYVNESMPEQSHRQRWQLQPLMRAFAEESFRQWPEIECTSIRHAIASFYADYSSEVASLEDSEAILSYDEMNIMGALNWACKEQRDALVAKLCSGMQYFWVSFSRFEEGKTYLPEGIKAAQAIAEQTKSEDAHFRLATLQQTYAQLLQKVGQVEIARTNFDKALTYFKQMTDQQGEYEILASLGELAQQRGELKEAEGYYRQSLTILRALQDELNGQGSPEEQEENETFVLYRQGEGEILTSLGELAQQRGRLREAEGYYKQSLSILRETGSRESQVHDLIHLGEIAQYRGQKGEAEQRFRDALVITRQANNHQREGIVLARMADLALSFNQTRVANNHCQKALALAREVKHGSCECRVLCCMGKIEKDRVLAETYYKNALKIAQEVQDKQEESRVDIYLGDIAQANGHIGEAETYYRAALAITDTFQDALVYAEVALKLGELLIEHHMQLKDQPDEGCRRIREAVQLYALMKLPNEQDAQRILRRVGCKDDNKETILIR